MITAFWYLGRGTGVVSLVLLTLVVVLGIVTRSGRPMPGLPRFAVTALHRSTSLLAVSFLGVHVLTLIADPQAQLRWFSAVLPFTGGWRPFWVGLGTLAVDLLAALVVTSLLRHRIGQRAWRAVHWTAYATWPLALIHALKTGTDAATTWMLAVMIGSLACVLAAIAWRLSAGFLDERGRVPGSLRPVTPVRPDPVPVRARPATTRDPMPQRRTSERPTTTRLSR